ncbi:MAG: helix-hairpin-helix domain-containing protein [Actinomycetota bacterium]|nr:helix-hairpin-helix domain-containing protein [Actinomycetota bacterium]
MPESLRRRDRRSVLDRLTPSAGDSNAPGTTSTSPLDPAVVLGDPDAILDDPGLAAPYVPTPWPRRLGEELVGRVGPDRLVAALVVVVGVVAAVGLLGGWLLGRTVRPATEELLARPVPVTTSTVAVPPEPMVVHVAGAVVSEGIVELDEGARVADALAAAGGPAPVADLGRVNLAEPLGDGARVFVPAVGEASAPQPVAVVGPSSAEGDDTRPVEVNRAGPDELERLPGVGPALATAIVAHRDEHGPFSSVDDLLAVSGIGPAKLAGFRDLVVV